LKVVTRQAHEVYAYDLVITDRQGQTRRTRDPFSFLPTLGERSVSVSARAMSASHL
jgi:hypothetical protein